MASWPTRRRTERDGGKPWLLAPVDLQVLKAAGVTFAVSMLERVIEERARGNPPRRRRSVPKLCVWSATTSPAEAGFGGGDAAQGGTGRAAGVEPVPGSRHRPGRRRGLHQGAGAVLGRHLGWMPACIQNRAGTIPSRRSCWWCRAAGRIVGADTRQRRQPQGLRRALGAAAVQGQGQQCVLRHRTVPCGCSTRPSASTMSETWISP